MNILLVMICHLFFLLVRIVHDAEVEGKYRAQVKIEKANKKNQSLNMPKDDKQIKSNFNIIYKKIAKCD